MSPLTERFDQALLYAHHLHRQQSRKDQQVPYIAHLLSVAALVLENGGDEDQAIAALLHDAVEDQGGIATREGIRQRFGDRVTAIVEGCTEPMDTPRPAWTVRKLAYLAALRQASPEVRRVSLADKLHNARSLVAFWAQEGETVWSRFSGGKDGLLWYYRALNEIYQVSGDDYLSQEFQRTLRQIEGLGTAQ